MNYETYFLITPAETLALDLGTLYHKPALDAKSGHELYSAWTRSAFYNVYFAIVQIILD